MIKKFVFAAAALLAMVSCGKAGFQVSGVVEGGADSVKMVIEQASNGRWLIVDSVFHQWKRRIFGRSCGHRHILIYTDCAMARERYVSLSTVSTRLK